MVGICGRLGQQDHGIDPLPEWATWSDEETTGRYEDDRVTLATSFHDLLAGDQPARAADGDVLVWVWGDVYGYGDGDAYEPRRGAADESAAYCAALYDEHGASFVEELNGGFALVLHDRRDGTVSFVTDRLATRPVFVARPREDTLVFASNSQALAHLPDVEAAFDEDYLREYLALRRVLGVETPLVGVEELQPGAVTTVDLSDCSTAVGRYWSPSYRPVDRSFSSHLSTFTETIERVLAEWTRDDLEYGLLLSGGSDSRLVQAAMDQQVTAFHTADWLSREARTARRAAEARGDEFRLLERDPRYERRALDRNPALSNFSGWFDQAYFLGFADELTEVDVLVSGLYADMLFGGHQLTTPRVSLGPVGTLSVPIATGIQSVEEYVTRQARDAVEPIPYLDGAASVTDVLAENVHRDGREVVSHGVRYGSLRDLVMYGDFCPLGADTDAIFSRALMQLRPYRTPFLDNRLLELQQQLPVKHLLRRNVVGRATAELAPELADIPHARTGVPLKHRFPLAYLGENVNGALRKHLPLYEEPPPAPHLDHDPWPDRSALVRERSFVRDTIESNAELLSALPALDADGAENCYRAHLAGADNTTLLYSLVTLLEMPVTAQVVHADRPDQQVEE